MLARSTILALALLAAFPIAAADVTCVDAPAGSACVSTYDSQVTSRAVWFAGADGTFVAVSETEGSGFFGNTATADAYADSPALARYVVLVVALNDKFPSDGTYEDGGAYVGTWQHDGFGVVAAWAGYSDSDGDGQPDVDGLYSGFAVLP